MMFSCSHRVLFLLSIVFFVLLNFSLGFSDRSDAFSILGIPNLNPREMLRDIESDEQKQELDQMNNYINRGKPSKGNPSGNETLSKGRTPDQFGAVQDISGFDGLSLEETHGLEGTEERLVQRCRSAANLYMKSKYPSQFFNAVNAEKQNSEFIENWRIFKAFLVSPRGESQVLKICLPLDESINPLVSEKDDSCEERIKQYTMKTDQHVVQLMPGEQHKFVGGQNALNSPAGQHQFGPEGNKNPQSLGGKYDKNNFNFKQQGAEQKYEAQVIPTQSHNVTIASNIENRNLKSNGNEYLMNKLMYLQSQVNMLYNEIQSNNQVKSRDLEQRFLKNYQR